jgi:hypothetical protein
MLEELLFQPKIAKNSYLPLGNVKQADICKIKKNKHDVSIT